MSETQEQNGSAAPQTAIAKRAAQGMQYGQHGVVIRNYEELGLFCNGIARAGFFKNALTAERAMVIIQFGAEIGIPPMAALMNVHLIDGKPCIGASLIAARIEGSGTRRYTVKSWTRDGCTLSFERNDNGEWRPAGDSTFEKVDADGAGLLGKDNWRKWPRAMYFHRALAQGARAYCPSVFFGAVYTPEELGANVNESGEVIDAGTGDVVAQRPQPGAKTVRSAAADVAAAVGAPPPTVTVTNHYAGTPNPTTTIDYVAPHVAERSHDPPRPVPTVEDAERRRAELAAEDARAAAAFAAETAEVLRRQVDAPPPTGKVDAIDAAFAEPPPVPTTPAVDAAAGAASTPAGASGASSDTTKAAADEAPGQAPPPAKRKNDMPLGDAVRGMPPEPEKMPSYVASLSKRMATADYKALQVFGRARFQRSRKLPADNGMTDADKVMLAAAIAAGGVQP